jgi:hypothetical protein
MHPRALSANLRNLSVTDFLGLCDAIARLAETSPSDRGGMLELCESGLQVFRSAAALNASFRYAARRRVLAVRSSGHGQAESKTTAPARHARAISATAIRLHSFGGFVPSPNSTATADATSTTSTAVYHHASLLDVRGLQRAAAALYDTLTARVTPANRALDEFLLEAVTSSVSQIATVSLQLQSVEQLRAVLVLLISTLVWSSTGKGDGSAKGSANRRPSVQKKWEQQVSTLWISLGKLRRNAKGVLAQWILTLPPAPSSSSASSASSSAAATPNPPQGRLLIRRMVSLLDANLVAHLRAGKSPPQNSSAYMLAQILQDLHTVSSSMDTGGRSTTSGGGGTAAASVVKKLLEAKPSAGDTTATSTSTSSSSSSSHDDSIFYSAVASKYSPQHLVNQYTLWAREKRGMGNAGFSVCKFPFLLRPDVKRKLMEIESQLQMQHMYQAAQQSSFAQLFSRGGGGGGRSPQESPFLGIQVRRSHIVEDSISVARKLSTTAQGARDLKKKLKVQFRGEAGVDAGGVTKEYFQLLTQEIMGSKFGMWIDVGGDAAAGKWFNAATFESTDTFAMVGLLLGLGIYNGVVLDLHFPRAVYRKLLGQPLTLSDMRELQPAVVDGMAQLLAYEEPDGAAEAMATVEDLFGLVFEASYLAVDGTPINQELKPGGSEIPVTADNREEYVAAYLQWYMEDLIAEQFDAFAKGFTSVVNGLTLGLFSPWELELMVEGEQRLDFVALREIAVYEGGYSKDHMTIRRFWDICVGGGADDFGDDERLKLLRFFSGAARAPMGGLGKLVPPLKIQRMSPDSDKLPTAATCFNTLLLPDYASRGKMKEKLLVAIENASGFGLE